MSWRTVLLVYAKELRETLRDRRTLVLMVLLPLGLYPIVGIGLTQWMVAQRVAREDRASVIGMAGASWPALERALSRRKLIRLAGRGTPAQVRSGQLDAVVQVEPDYPKRLSEDGTAGVRVYFDSTQENSTLAEERVKSALSGWASALREERLKRRGLPLSLADPLRVDRHSLATPQEVGAHAMTGVLPLLLLLMVFLGAFYPAIDLTAGEKERGTLETLFTTPAPRLAVVTGKYLVVATLATMTGALNLGSIGLTFALGFGPALRAAKIATAVPWSLIALTALALIPAALFFAALMIALAALARSSKEGQQVLAPIYMACVVVAGVVQMPGIELNALTATVPVANVALLTRELIRGRLAIGPMALAMISTLVYAFVALRLAARVFQSERLLFSAEGRRRGSPRPRRTIPSPAEAGLLLLLTMALLLLLGPSVQSHSVIGGMLITEWVFIALPVLLLVRLAPLEPAPALGWRRPGALQLLGAGLAGASGWYVIGVLVEGLQQRVLPMPPEFIEEMKRLLVQPGRPLALELLALALTPAICEELLFRGVVLRASWPALSAPVAVLANGILFGLFHMSIYRFLPTFSLGVVLALIAIRSGSVVPGMLFHFLNNASAILAVRFLGQEPEAAISKSALLAGGVALAVFVSGLSLVLRHPRLGDRDAPPGRSS